ncbi:MAG: hypothetical protein Q8P26_02895 [Candidatus Levybacteria bacterium]|nr:hypothetical protein [Candidatus Levybacteria bacterium]
MKYLSLTVPGYGRIDSNDVNLTPIPKGIQTGGLEGSGANIITTLLTMIVLIAILFSIWLIVTGGIDIIASTGDKQKMQHGRQKILYAILGLVVIFGSFLALNILGQAFNINLLFPFMIPSK